MLPRERLIEIAVSVGGVFTMVAILYTIGLQYADDSTGRQELSATGGEMVVFAIAGFVVLMAVIGVVLIYTVTVVEAENDDGTDPGTVTDDGDANGA